ncbi:MAG: HEPN domain-containing protein [Campylobacterota bacterium]|nr:HEPN domain-containing protein [Campylobacterota bacterium]
MNKTEAKRWINKAWHHLSSAKLLFNANHYTDVIGVDLHYSVEIMLKSFIVFENKKIVKTHNLISIYKSVSHKITLIDEELDLLDIITDYHIEEAYPTMDRPLPSKDEIKIVLKFTEELLIRVCGILNIDIKEIQI